MKMKIVCNEEEKRVLLQALHDSTFCPFPHHYCVDEEITCKECSEKYVNWELVNEDSV